MAFQMAAYVNDSNLSENLVYESHGSLVHQALVRGTAWAEETVATDIYSQSGVAAFWFSLQNTEHILYIDKTGNLIELVRDSPSGTGIGPWHKNVPYVDQNLLLSFRPSPLTAWIAPNDTEHWVYAKNYASDGIWWTEFWYTNNLGSQVLQLPAQYGNGPFGAPNGFPSVTSYVDTSGYEHIVYARYNDPNDPFKVQLTELYTSQSDHPNWSVNENLSGIDPNGGLIGYAESYSGAQHIFCLFNGTVIENYFSGPPWKSSDLIQRAGATPPMPNNALAGHDFPQDGTIHVFYISRADIQPGSITGLEVCELYAKYGTSTWFFNNLTVNAVGGRTHLPSFAYIDPGMPLTSYVWPYDNSQHVVYIDRNTPPNVIDLWYVAKEGTWTATPVGPWDN
jgi:hypothetical protein